MNHRMVSTSWTDQDQILLDTLAPQIGDQKYPFPRPALSELERKRRRLAFRNERNLYHRNSSLSGKPIISMYSPDKPFPVYAKVEYWSDQCDARAFGIEYDFSKSFFEQVALLKKQVPRVALITDQDADKNNCAYINFAGYSKNCYMAFNADENQDCYYISSTFYSRDCVDCSHMQKSELCYECIGCTRCYDLRYSQDCTDCHSSLFLFGCVSCANCFCCSNLIQGQYCINNVQYSKEDYLAEVSKLDLGRRSTIVRVKRSFEDFLSQQPRRFAQILRSENCTGDYILDSKDCADCFNIRECRDVRHADIVHRANDCMDLSAFGVGIELVYNSTSIGVNSSRIYCSYACVLNSSDLFYCDECRQSQHCFGCISLKRSSYCILNKQYTSAEYFALVPRIISHLQETGEWGQFFPYSLSAFGYNESIAQEKFPLSEELARSQNIPWHNAEVKQGGPDAHDADQLPDSITDANQGICEQIFLCPTLKKPYRISKPEFSFYQRLKIALPTECPDARYASREARRNPEQLWERNCSISGAPLLTTYSPEFKGQVLSEAEFWKYIG